MIHVIANITLAPGRCDVFLDEFRRIVPLVRAEAGCLEYGPTIDVASSHAAQIGPREDVVTVVEKWESLEALQAHLVAPHMLEYRSRVKDWVLGVQLQVLQPV
jgi:quinol monooxygenase YgiN